MLHIASRYGHSEVVECLVERAHCDTSEFHVHVYFDSAILTINYTEKKTP